MVLYINAVVWIVHLYTTCTFILWTFTHSQSISCSINSNSNSSSFHSLSIFFHLLFFYCNAPKHQSKFITCANLLGNKHVCDSDPDLFFKIRLVTEKYRNHIQNTFETHCTAGFPQFVVWIYCSDTWKLCVNWSFVCWLTQLIWFSYA